MMPPPEPYPMTTVKSLQLPQHAPQAAPSLAPPIPEHVSPKTALLGVLMPVLGSLVTALQLQMTNAGFTQMIAGELAFTPDEGTWVTVAYTSAELLIIPLAGWLSQAFSHRWYLSVNAALFVCFSIACASASDLSSMIVFQALQGLVAGGFTVLAFTRVLTHLPRSKQHIGLIFTSITAGLPASLGPILAGWLINDYRWQYIYYLNVALGMLVMAGIWHWVQPQPMRLSLLKQIDWLGTIVLAIGVISLLTVLERGNTENWFDSEFIVLLSIISVLFLALFCWIELNHQNPLINLRILRQRTFGLANILNLAVGLLLSYPYVVTQYLYQIQGYNLLQIGRLLVWGSIINPLLGKLIEHIESRLLLAIGFSIFATSCFINSTFSYYVAAHELVWSQLVRALGLPMSIALIAFIATDNIKKEQADDASVIFNMIRTFTGAMGTSIIGTLLTKREQYHSNIIVDSVSIYNHQTQARLQELSQLFTGKLGDPHAAQSQARSMIAQTVRREAYVMAFSDCFIFIGVGVLLSGIVILFLKKIKKPGESVN